MTDRCTWSDLHPDECAHCTGATNLTGPTRWTDDPTPQPKARPTTSTHRQARLPILGNTEHNQPDLHDMIYELVRPHGHREHYTTDLIQGTRWSRDHITRVPSLIHQLLDATPTSSGSEVGSAAVSKPNARIEAIDTLMLIDDEASRWVKRLGENDPGDTLDRKTGRRVPGSGTIACIQLLHGLHASTEKCGRPKPHRSDAGRPDCCTSHVIEHDVRRWWHQARIITGWDSPSWRPFNTCPICNQRGSLRINPVLHAAFCVECREVWSSDTIGLLAEHIRTENCEEDSDTPDAESA